MTGVWSDDLGGVLVLDRMCSTCIFRPGNLMHLSPGRVKSMVDSTRPSRDHRSQPQASHITCHATLHTPGVHPAMCRGFYDLPDSPSRPRPQMLQVMDRVGGFRFVPPPEGH
jgi:hypothetical protein